jgi:putative membrane protein
MMWGYYDGWNWLWMASMMILFWAGVIALAFVVIRSFNRFPSKDLAMDDLRGRFANGDITQDEFEQRRKALQG